MGDNVYIDDHLNCSDEPTAIRPVSNTQSAYIEVVIPEVEITGTIPPLLQETDSVSTFRSKKKDRSVARGSVTFDTHTDNQRDSQKPSASSFKTANEGNVPKDLNKDMEDGSVSKLSDTASRLSAFEERFNMVTEEITDTFEEFKQTQTEQRELLTTILRHLQLNQSSHIAKEKSNDSTPSPGPVNIHEESTEAADRQSSISSVQATHLSQLKQTGVTDGDAGTDS